VLLICFVHAFYQLFPSVFSIPTLIDVCRILFDHELSLNGSSWFQQATINAGLPEEHFILLTVEFISV
jgi:hypothetical protein